MIYRTLLIEVNVGHEWDDGLECAYVDVKLGKLRDHISDTERSALERQISGATRALLRAERRGQQDGATRLQG